MINVIKNSVENLLDDRLRLLKSQDNESIFLFGPINLPLKVDTETYNFKWYTWLKNENRYVNNQELLATLPFENLEKLQQSSVLVYGDFQNSDDVVVRMHSICHTGDIFGSQKCDCGSQLKFALKGIIKEGSGALFYLAEHEGRGIGLFSKAMTYALQEKGYDTAEANRILGFEDDYRDYGEVVAILKNLRKKPIKLITNNPLKSKYLEERGIKINSLESAISDVCIHNKKYLETKIREFEHTILLPN